MLDCISSFTRILTSPPDSFLPLSLPLQTAPSCPFCPSVPTHSPSSTYSVTNVVESVSRQRDPRSLLFRLGLLSQPLLINPLPLLLLRSHPLSLCPVPSSRPCPLRHSESVPTSSSTLPGPLTSEFDPIELTSPRIPIPISRAVLPTPCSDPSRDSPRRSSRCFSDDRDSHFQLPAVGSSRFADTSS